MWNLLEKYLPKNILRLDSFNSEKYYQEKEIISAFKNSFSPAK